nr:RNA-binding S4 domain-containing protein [Alkaliphilus pronyensis]
MKKINLDGDFIKLDQLLKTADIVGSGGQAKLMILNGDVKVNGVTINQRGKKIRQGDLVEVEGYKIKVE